MLWGFKLEFKQSLRSKKLIGTLLIILFLYVPFLYFLKEEPGTYMSTREIMATMSNFVTGIAIFFVGMLAMIMGATAINSEVEKGTLRVAMSKPVSRLAYIGGKMLAHVTILFIALLVSVGVAIGGMALIGIDLTAGFVWDMVLLNVLLLIGITGLLFLGYLLSAFIKSPINALVLALVLFFIIWKIAPAVVEYEAFTHAASYKDYQGHVLQEYKTKYLFFDPSSQIEVMLSNMTERTCFAITKRIEPNGEERVLEKKEVPNCSGVWGSSGYPGVGQVSYTCSCQDVYAGVGHSLRFHLVNLVLMIGTIIAYAGFAIFRFLRMDLR
ncbi:ABC transporter permease subunit [Thermococcus sp.]